ncbi:hypothetical protein MTR_5g063750 [Medicago truncatula]|uniref:Uncharacterized protein n=1 Tax=Medicago truncatula TaxID=3880 RepID=G7KB80_MEDTR|nr:hypothetical protein MTR_5g063750 [Medicago truncatula]
MVKFVQLRRRRRHPWAAGHRAGGTSLTGEDEDLPSFPESGERREVREERRVRERMRANIGVALSDNRKTEVSVDKHLNVLGSVNFGAEENAPIAIGQ